MFRLRSECAKLGEKILAENPSGNDNFIDSQVSHYNPLTNRCYVELRDSTEWRFVAAVGHATFAVIEGVARGIELLNIVFFAVLLSAAMAPR